MILDTNIVLYHSRDMLATPLGKGVFAISFITEIEILGFPGITADEERELRRMLADDIRVIGMTEEIKERSHPTSTFSPHQTARRSDRCNGIGT